jgi:predicted O-methyltransferase YrrM
MNYFANKFWTGTDDTSLNLCEALAWAAAEVKPFSYLEVGVDNGRSCKVVFGAHVPKRVVFCDLWDPDYAWGGQGFSGHNHISQWLRGIGYSESSVLFLDGDSRVLIPTLKESFDLILVDGGHSFEVAFADLINCWPLLNPKGLLVLDDVKHPTYFEVARAFNTFVACTSDVDIVPESKALWRESVVLCKKIKDLV